MLVTVAEAHHVATYTCNLRTLRLADAVNAGNADAVTGWEASPAQRGKFARLSLKCKLLCCRVDLACAARGNGVAHQSLCDINCASSKLVQVLDWLNYSESLCCDSCRGTQHNVSRL